MNVCIFCKSPIPPERVICQECAKNIINREVKVTIATSRQNGKTYLRRLLDNDLKFYGEQMKGDKNESADY